MAIIIGVSVPTKLYVTGWIVLLALFEFFTAMYVYGSKGPKRFGPWVLRLHRIGGYLFALAWLWPISVGLGFLGRLSSHWPDWRFDGPRFFHAFLGVGVLLLLLLKILFVRFYRRYRPYAQLLGIILVVLVLLTWSISGWFWLNMMGTPVIEP